MPFAATVADGPRCPDFSWDTSPPYIHVREADACSFASCARLFLTHRLPIQVDESDEVPRLQLHEIEVKSYGGGLVKAFERKAAWNIQTAAFSCNRSE